MALETKPYQVNPSPVNSYLYQQTIPRKGKEAFPWILHEFDTLPPRFWRPYQIKEPIIIPLNQKNDFQIQDNQKTPLKKLPVSPVK